MNKLQFHEGGQPVNLNDLQLLQDNTLQAVAALFGALTANEPVFLLKLPSIAFAKKGSKIEVRIAAGKMVENGELLEWPDTTIESEMKNPPLFLCVRETEGDARIFADGQTRNCRKNKQAYISTEAAGAASAYNITEIPLFSDLLVKDGEWIYSQAEFYNGYVGSFKFRVLNGKTRIVIEVASTNTNWSTDGVFVYGKSKAILGIRNQLLPPSIYSSVFPVKNQHGQTIGKVVVTNNDVLVFEPAEDSMTPANCPIKLDITL